MACAQMFGMLDQEAKSRPSQARQQPQSRPAERPGQPEGPQMSGFSAVSLLPELPSRRSQGQVSSTLLSSQGWLLESACDLGMTGSASACCGWLGQGQLT